MTIQEKAIEQLERISEHLSAIGEKEDYTDIAIKALEAQTCIEDYPTCTECEHYDSEKHYCPRFCQVIKDTLAEAQPCEDCISRQKALDCFEQTNTRQGAKYAIETLPSVTPQRPKGKWIMNSDYPDRLICDKCNAQFDVWHWESKQMHFCPNCGAEMNGGGEDEVSD